MFNPFHPFTPELLSGMVAQDKRYFVRQRFGVPAILSNGTLSGKSYLLTPYENLAKAQEHFDTLAGDPTRFLYDWENSEHQEKLGRAAGLNEKYQIFGAVLRTDWESLLTNNTRKKIRSYIAALGWQPKRGDTVDFVFELRFGELYASIKYRQRRTTAKFEDIENQLACATTSRFQPPLN